jgi:hypothetical protein
MSLDNYFFLFVKSQYQYKIILANLFIIVTDCDNLMRPSIFFCLFNAAFVKPWCNGTSILLLIKITQLAEENLLRKGALPNLFDRAFWMVSCICMGAWSTRHNWILHVRASRNFF